MKQMSPQDQPPIAQVSTGKRSAEETKMTEGLDEDLEYPEAEHLNTPEGRKRVDLKRTPQKSESSRTKATTPSSISMESPPFHRKFHQQVDPHSWTPDSVSTVYPDNPNHRPLHIGGDGPSNNEHESDTVMSGPRFSPFHDIQTGEFDDDHIKLTQIKDIYLQHEESNRVNDSSQQRLLTERTTLARW